MNNEEQIKKPKVLLFCDNPACFANHLAKKIYPKKQDVLVEDGE